MGTNDLYDQVENILKGRTADGAPGHWEPTTLDVANEATLALILGLFFREVTRIHPSLLCTDDARTAVIRVVIRWANVAKVDATVIIAMGTRLYETRPLAQ